MNEAHFLVGHGSSTVPEKFVDRINRYGGRLMDTSGVPEPVIKQGRNLGIRKYNIDTDLRLAFNLGLRKSLNNLDPREILKNSMIEMQKLVEHKIILFGSKGKAR